MSVSTSLAKVSVGQPSGVTLTQLVGAARVNDWVNVFAVGSDGNLWGRSYYGSAWLDWVNIGAPAGKLAPSGNGSAGNVLVSGGTVWVFCLANDGTVWCAVSANHTPWQWMPAPGKPLPGTTVKNLVGTLPSPFSVTVTDSADQSFSALWNGSAWIWAVQPNPLPSPNVTREGGGPTATLGWDHKISFRTDTGVRMEDYSVIRILFWLRGGEVTCEVAGFNHNNF